MAISNSTINVGIHLLRLSNLHNPCADHIKNLPNTNSNFV